MEGFSTYKSLTEFLESRIHSLDQTYLDCNKNLPNEEFNKFSNNNRNRSPQKNNNHNQRSVNVHSANVSSNKGKKNDLSCSICENKHIAWVCPMITDLDVQKRRDLVREKNLCFNCLRKGHMVSQCNSTKRCMLCKGAHNTIVHIDKENTQVFVATKSSEDIENNSVVEAHLAIEANSCSFSKETLINPQSTVLLATAEIVLKSSSGSITVKALIDPGT